MRDQIDRTGVVAPTAEAIRPVAKHTTDSSAQHSTAQHASPGQLLHPSCHSCDEYNITLVISLAHTTRVATMKMETDMLVETGETYIRRDGPRRGLATAQLQAALKVGSSGIKLSDHTPHHTTEGRR
jgi:hypothetical protein